MAVELKVKYHQTEVQPGLQSYDLRVEVVSATDMPTKIFVMQRGAPPAPMVGETVTDRFICIADPVDLEEFPEDDPDIDNEIPYYRIDDITLRFRSLDILQETRDLIDADLKQLVKTMKLVAVMEVLEEVTYA